MTYDIEMRVEGENGNQFHREVTVNTNLRDDEAKFSTTPEEVAFLAKTYGQDFPEDGLNPTKFKSVFDKKTPTDVGGAGYFLRWNNLLGNASVYIERFRGSDDLASQLKQRETAVDQFVDLLMAWLANELSDYSELKKLQSFVDEELRSDLQNLSIYLWRTPQSADENNLTETALRLVLYFAERDYFEPEQLCEIASWENDDLSPQLSMLPKIAARKASIDADVLRQKLQPYQDEKRMLESWTKLVSEKPQFKQFQKTLQEDSNINENEAASKFVSEIVLRGFLWEFSSTNVTVAFESLTEPILTNGKFLPDENKIEWSSSISSKKAELTSLPAFFYATWSEPSPEFQKKAFGDVILRDESLLGYTFWSESLTKASRDQWESFLSKLSAANCQKQLGDQIDAWTSANKSHPLLRGAEMLKSQLKSRQ